MQPAATQMRNASRRTNNRIEEQHRQQSAQVVHYLRDFLRQVTCDDGLLYSRRAQVCPVSAYANRFVVFGPGAGLCAAC